MPNPPKNGRIYQVRWNNKTKTYRRQFETQRMYCWLRARGIEAEIYVSETSWERVQPEPWWGPPWPDSP